MPHLVIKKRKKLRPIGSQFKTRTQEAKHRNIGRQIRNSYELHVFLANLPEAMRDTALELVRPYLRFKVAVPEASANTPGD